MSTKRRSYLASAAVVVVATSTIAAPAYAKDESTSVVASIMALSETVDSPATNALSLGSTFDAVGKSWIGEASSRSTLAIEGHEDPVILLDTRSSTIAISGALPGAASVAEDGALVYHSPADYSVVPIPHKDGSIQVTTVIGSSSAPDSYSYDLSSSTDVVLKAVDGGSVLIENLDGGYIAAVAPPWAYDAMGTPVPTRFEIVGSTLTQVVSHHDDDFAYPVIADPWLGVNLFGSITVDTFQSQPRVNLDLSLWGQAIYVGTGGTIILDTAGWDEAWTRSAAIQSALDKPSQRQQFSCHALGALFAGQWNLEKFRVNRTGGDWFTGVGIHHCNWTTASGT